MTQRLCQRLAGAITTASEAAVEAVQRLVASLFGRIALDPNLQFADAYLAHYSKEYRWRATHTSVSTNLFWRTNRGGIHKILLTIVFS